MASQAKDRHSAQLARTLADFSKTIAYTTVLLDHLAVDLKAMKTLSAIHVGQFMTVAGDVDTSRESVEEQDHSYASDQ